MSHIPVRRECVILRYSQSKSVKEGLSQFQFLPIASFLFLIIYFSRESFCSPFAYIPADTQNLSTRSSQPSYYLRQLQLLKLFNNMVCVTDENLRDLSESFNPLQNLHLYQKPELVRSYFEGLETGQLKGEIFPRFFKILLLIDDWELFYKTFAYALARVNSKVLHWALRAIVASKYAHERFRTPPSYEVLPQLSAPKRVVYSYNGVEGPETNLTNGLEDRLNYFKDDPSLNAFHLMWHMDLPLWWNFTEYKIQKDRKGELFLYMHKNLLNRYRAERLSIDGLDDIRAFQFNEEIKVGYVPNVLNINFEEFPIRYNHTSLDLSNSLLQKLQTTELRLIEDISNGILQSENGSKISLRSNSGYDYVGAAVEYSYDSPSRRLYGNVHNNRHAFISKIRDRSSPTELPSGAIANPETSIRDPVFFHIHTLVNKFYILQSQNLREYTEADVRLDGIDLSNVRVMIEEGEGMPPSDMRPFEPHTPVLETFFEDFSFDISRGVMSCEESRPVKEASATIKRHNHKPFRYYLKVHLSKMRQMNATVRIYMSPVKDYDGKEYSDEKLYANMFEMDRFPVTLSNGENIIVRSSKDSSVTVPDATPTKQLVKETEEALAAGKERPDDSSSFNYRHCGYPHHLLVPKGTPEGQSFKMFVIITKYQPLDERSYPGLPLCGVQTGEYPDKEPMGFPFDRKINFEPSSSVHKSYKFLDVIVRLKE